MKQFIVASVLFFLFCPSFSYSMPQVNWTEWEVPYSDADMKNVIAELPKQNKFFKFDASTTHFVDLNNDNLVDVIYNGNPGLETDWCTIHFNTGQGYKQVFSSRGRISKLFKEPDSDVISFEINDLLCCDEFISYVKECKFDKEKSYYQIVRREMYYSVMKWPDKYLKECFNFKVNSVSCEMLARPTSTNEILAPTSSYDEVLRNKLFALSDKTRGLILAEFTADEGTKYYFVKVDYTYVTEKLNPFYYHDKDTSNLFVLGWINSKYLKKD
jgi:hypothetical protein